MLTPAATDSEMKSEYFLVCFILSSLEYKDMTEAFMKVTKGRVSDVYFSWLTQHLHCA